MIIHVLVPFIHIMVNIIAIYFWICDVLFTKNTIYVFEASVLFNIFFILIPSLVTRRTCLHYFIDIPFMLNITYVFTLSSSLIIVYGHDETFVSYAAPSPDSSTLLNFELFHSMGVRGCLISATKSGFRFTWCFCLPVGCHCKSDGCWNL